MNVIKGLLKLIRFELPFAAGICVIMGQLFALGKFPSVGLIVLSFLSVFLISASILVLNDYFDIETDKINAPHRPIPSNMVTPFQALIFFYCLLIIGLLISYLISLPTLILTIILSLVGFLYNRHFKKTGLLGNLMVSFSVGMTFIYGGVTVNLPFNKIVMLFGLIAALIDLGEEIAADAMDSKGDQLIDSNSVAIKYGNKFALKVSSFIFLLVILLTSAPFLFNWFSFYYLFPIAIMDFSILYFTIKLLRSKNDEGRKYIRFIYLGATFGLVVFLIVRLLGI